MARYSKDVDKLKEFKVKVNDSRPYGVKIYFPVPLYLWLDKPKEITLKKKGSQIIIEKA